MQCSQGILFYPRTACEDIPWRTSLTRRRKELVKEFSRKSRISLQIVFHPDLPFHADAQDYFRLSSQSSTRLQVSSSAWVVKAHVTVGGSHCQHLSWDDGDLPAMLSPGDDKLYLWALLLEDFTHPCPAVMCGVWASYSHSPPSPHHPPFNTWDSIWKYDLILVLLWRCPNDCLGEQSIAEHSKNPKNFTRIMR